jgi:hypothetical protein
MFQRDIPSPSTRLRENIPSRMKAIWCHVYLKIMSESWCTASKTVYMSWMMLHDQPKQTIYIVNVNSTMEKQNLIWRNHSIPLVNPPVAL